MRSGTALITGGNSVIGKETVKLFLEAGWTVLATARETGSVHTAPCLHWFEMDLTDEGSIAAVTTEILSTYPNLNVLINNAGHVLSGPFEALSEKRLRYVMEVNFFAATRLIRAVLPHFRNQREGTIVNVTSLCGLVAFPMFSGYHASKWALEGFSESLYHELTPLGIKTKLVEPGGVDSKEHQSQVEVCSDVPRPYQELLDKVHHNSWYPCFSSPMEVAQVILRAASTDDDRLRYAIGDDFEVFLKERNYLKNGQEAVSAIGMRIHGSERAS